MKTFYFLVITQTLSLIATLAERNLQTSANFYLATQGFTIGVSTVRPVYVSGETFEAAGVPER